MQSYGLVSIGSHTGIWLQEELRTFNLKKNILIEPVPYNIDQLEENTRKFHNVIIEKSAVSDKDEIVSFFYLKKVQHMYRLLKQLQFQKEMIL